MGFFSNDSCGAAMQKVLAKECSGMPEDSKGDLSDKARRVDKVDEQRREEQQAERREQAGKNTKLREEKAEREKQERDERVRQKKISDKEEQMRREKERRDKTQRRVDTSCEKETVSYDKALQRILDTCTKCNNCDKVRISDFQDKLKKQQTGFTLEYPGPLSRSSAMN